jgi:cytochrome c1
VPARYYAGIALLLAAASAAWAADARPADAGPAVARPALAPVADAKRGQLLLARYHCGSCHLIPGVPAARSSTAVTLQAFGRRSYIAGRVANTPDMLQRWIRQPQALVPGTLMPDLGVSEVDARDIAAYLGALR